MNKHFVAIVGLLFLSVSCGAWEFVPGEVVREPGPVSRQIKDPNGKLCAELLIDTKLTVSFETGILGFCSEPEKTPTGYRIFLPSQSRKLLLSAPGFKSIFWWFDIPSERSVFSAGSVQEGRVYRASLSSAGKEPEASLQTVVWGKVMPNSFNLAALVETEDHAPQLWIHTDWPFAWIKSRFLRKGTYQVVNKDAAPYVLRILGKNSFAQVWQGDNVQTEDMAPTEPLRSHTVYELELFWSEKPLSEDVKNSLRTRLTPLTQK